MKFKMEKLPKIHAVHGMDGRHNAVSIMMPHECEDGLPHPLLGSIRHGPGCIDQATAERFAEQICRAVNSHAELLEALEMAIKWSDEVPSPYQEFPFIAAARAAIAKASK